jgi:tRNA(Ile2) C34 agmatinyltransferase TiaS
MSAVALDIELARRPRCESERPAGSRRERALARPAADGRCAGTVQDPARGGLTLDELIVGVWEGLAAHHTVACPVCGGAMTPRPGSGPAPVGGRCRDCGSALG